MAQITITIDKGAAVTSVESLLWKYGKSIEGAENYKQVYRWSVRGLSDREKLYYKLLLATDTISGMTDSYARDLYTDLNGIT